MRILMDSGDYRCSNMGDLAMLQVAVSRFRRLFPFGTIETITANSELLRDQVPETVPVPQAGLQAWFAERYLLGRLHDALPRSASREIIRFKGALRRRWPALVESMMKTKMRLTGFEDRDLLGFLESVREADFVVLCGQGGINDTFYKHALAVLDFIDMAIESGKPTALFGQGIGPISNPALLNRCSSVLGRVELIAVREGKSGPALLRSMNVAPHRIVNTGDDAIELAYAAHPKASGDAIGVNIREASHTAIGSEMIDRLRHVFAGIAARYQVDLLPVPISRYPDCKDARDINRLLSGIDRFVDNGRELDTPLKVIRQVGRTRVVVTAAYHAALFALSQGIPVVGLAESQYCVDKFLGLADQFGCGVAIVYLSSRNLEDDLTSAIEKAWVSAEKLRDTLLEAAHRQVQAGISAYIRAAEMLSDRKAVA